MVVGPRPETLLARSALATARFRASGRAWSPLVGRAGIRVGAIGAAPATSRVVALVEGPSDLAAVEVALAVRGVDAAHAAVLSVGGVTNVPAVTEALASWVDVVVLCDHGEAALVRERVGIEPYVCDRDLEDELLAAAGTARVLSVLDDLGDSRSFDLFSAQPAQREVELTARLHRFLGTRSGRKVVAAAALAGVLAPGEQPVPLVELAARLTAA